MRPPRARKHFQRTRVKGVEVYNEIVDIFIAIRIRKFKC